MDFLHEMLVDTVPPNHLADVEWAGQYLDAGSPAGELIVLSLGETWGRTPVPLVQALGKVPDQAHGYQMSMYGLPRLRRTLRDYVAIDQRIADRAGWELAVSWTGTRSAMCDFARHLNGGQVLAVAPCWDYAGVFEPYGFQMRYLDAGAELTEQVQSYRESGAARDISVVVVNAQHNPTGANWSQQETRALLELAVDLGAAILIDDAYFGFCDRGAVPEPTSAVRILLDLLSQSATTVPWLAVRSLGKQFHCNGWGLGSVVASPDFLDWLVNESRPHHTYNYGVHLQWAMAEWLSDEAAVAEYLCREQAGYRTRRAAVLAGLVSCGVPADRIVTGPAAPYLLFPVPAEAGLSSYLRRSVLEAGVLLSDAWPLGRKADRPDTGYVRMYLGPDLERLSAAIGRLRAAGLL